MMTLRQAVWIIMGGKYRHQITGQLIALDAGAVAPLLAFWGGSDSVCGKKTGSGTGEIVAGLGILFIGMEMMGKPCSRSVIRRCSFRQ